MALGALLSGGAAGLMKGWDDNREAAKQEAAERFRIKLENTRHANNMSAARQEKEWADERARAKGLLDQQTAAADREFEAEQNRLDRASREKASALRAGKGGDPAIKRQIAYYEQGMKDAQDVLTSDDTGAITPEQREDAQKRYKAYEAEYRKLVGLQDREPEPFPVVNKVSAKFLGDNYNDPKAHEDFRKQFGEEQYQARVAQIESAMEAAKNKKQSRAAEAKKQSAPSLKDRYNKDVNLFEQAAGAVKGLSDKMSNQYRKDFLVQVENRVNDIIAMMKSGEEVPKGMLKLLNTAEQMPWIDHETKVLLNEVYANAVGKTAQEYPARED